MMTKVLHLQARFKSIRSGIPRKDFCNEKEMTHMWLWTDLLRAGYFKSQVACLQEWMCVNTCLSPCVSPVNCLRCANPPASARAQRQKGPVVFLHAHRRPHVVCACTLVNDQTPSYSYVFCCEHSRKRESFFLGRSKVIFIIYCSS